jgi:hypothetical protein
MALIRAPSGPYLIKLNAYVFFFTPSLHVNDFTRTRHLVLRMKLNFCVSTLQHRGPKHAPLFSIDFGSGTD